MSKPKKAKAAPGMVVVDDDRKLRAVPLHFCAGKWYGPNLQGFARYSDSMASTLLAEAAFSPFIKNDLGTTAQERAALWMMQNAAVGYAGKMAGWPVGAHAMGESRVLVTEALRLVTPQAGTWPTIQLLVESLLEDAEHDQATVFYVWLAASLRHLAERMERPGAPFQHCPALAIFGQVGSGKSALIDLVLKPLFGNRTANPLPFLTDGKFNKDLFEAALLVMDDKGASSNLEERRQRGDAMKSLIWNEEQRMEGKGVDALMVSPFWRLVIAGNSEDSSLNVCPALNDSLRDKLLLLQAVKADGLPEDGKQKAEWIGKLRAELPAFAHWLLRFHPPKRMKAKLDPRTGVLNFWHPLVAGALLEKQPECSALEVINVLFKAGWPIASSDPTERKVQGTATDFYTAMKELDPRGHYERMFNKPETCGKLLSELVKTHPHRFKKVMGNGVSHYRIERLEA